MSDIVDLVTPIQTAVLAALKAAIPPELAAVHLHVNQDTPPPFVTLGPIENSNEGGKNGQFELITIEVQTIFRGPGRAPLIAIQHAVRAALDNVDLVVAGVTPSSVKWLVSSASDKGPDGLTYAGISNFEVYAEPA